MFDAGNRVVPIVGAFVNQQDPAPGTPTNNPRSLMFPPGQFRSPGPLVGLPVFLFNSAVFQGQHVASDQQSADRAALAGGGGGRPLGAGDVDLVPRDRGDADHHGERQPRVHRSRDQRHGVGRRSSMAWLATRPTKNQFGGPTTDRTTGTLGGPVCTAGGCAPLLAGNPTRVVGAAQATVYHNVNGLPGTALPCNQTNPLCQVAISIPVPITNGVFGGTIGKQVVNPAGLTAERSAGCHDRCEWDGARHRPGHRDRGVPSATAPGRSRVSRAWVFPERRAC